MSSTEKKFDWTKTAVDDRPVRIGRDGTDPRNEYSCKCCKRALDVGDRCNEVFIYYLGNLISSGFFCTSCY